MSACRVAVLAGVALASASAEAGELRVAIALLGGVEADSGRAVESARAACAEHGLVPLPDGELRAALERPLAGDDLARARRQLGAAREAYTRFEYARALTELNAVDRLLVDREPSPSVVELMVERHLLAGLVHEGQGRPADARRDFRLVRRLDPDRRELDAGAYRPQVVALFAEAATDERRRGALRIDTEPTGARVFVDGRYAGQASLELESVAAGRHWVVAAAPGHRARGAIVDVEAREQGRTLALAAQSPAERATELRRSLGAASATGERRAAAAGLARVAGVHVLVLVRERDGQVEGAVFDARRGLLSGWLAVPSEPFSRRIAAAASPDLSAGADPGAGAIPLAGPAAEADRPPSWYSTWWGRTLIVAGGLAVGGAVFLAVSGGDDTYSLSGFCFAEQDC
jgi:hypothetical protein